MIGFDTLLVIYLFHVHFRRLRAVSNLGGKYNLSIPLTTPSPQCLTGRAKLQWAAAVISLGSHGKLLIHKWAMKSDMGWYYALLGYRRKKTLRSYQGHFKVKLSKII